MNPNKSFTRTDSDFMSQGTRCAAWLYRPAGVTESPIVIMGHGFAAERSFRLPAYAEAFAKWGLSVFLFDYRNFGDSDGEPRNLVNPFRHVADWRAAIAHVRTLPGVNKIALWGSSFGGGHVIVAAARDPEIAAIVAQVPFVDSLSTVAMTTWRNILHGYGAGFRDLFRILTFRSPYYIPVAAAPDTFAAMNTPECLDGVLSLIPENSSWENKCPARIAFTMSLYSPMSYAKRVKCPALVVMAEQDSLIDAKAVAKTTGRMSRATLLALPGGHFSVYGGETFEKVLQAETDFLVKHLFS
ncbi:MAG: alpha/beta hydrolase [bacterium]